MRGTRLTVFGVLYDVLVPIEGLNGATAPLVTIWLVDGARPLRLVSAWVDVP